MEKPKSRSGGESLLKSQGKDYFSKLAKKRWSKYKKEKELWKKAQGQSSKKTKKS